MTLKLSIPNTKNTKELKPKITVVGVGGAGGNAVNNMIRSHLEGVEFIVCNTDAQALTQSLCERRIQLGTNVTQGLGAGARPDIGRAAAEEVLDEIVDQLRDSHMVFIAAGMGGGTGTGAAPVIARATREQGILTVGVVTKPFHFEGLHRMRLAESGMKELHQFVDTLIMIPNQNLFRIANDKTTFADAFHLADQVLHSAVRGVTDLMVMPGLINLDFADIRSVMTEMGKAMMGTGEAEGEDRATAAAEAAISNPLLDDVSMKGAKGVLINITGGSDMTLFEVDEAANRIRDEVDPDANIIFGSTFDQELTGKMRISVVATGIDNQTESKINPSNPPNTFIKKGTKNLKEKTSYNDKGIQNSIKNTSNLPELSFDMDEDDQTLLSKQEKNIALEAEPENFEKNEDISLKSNAKPTQTKQVHDKQRRNPSLFARVTGVAAWNKPFQQSPAVTEEPKSSYKAPKNTAPTRSNVRHNSSTAVQVKLAGLEPFEQSSAQRQDEELLEIPAFLRRQAN
ncbi:MAG: cell division protein FtsZ [Alphaproteobacteria bacterium]|nr:cell division protein FtsZ [Alphaproteobacteria bacterium]